MPASPALPTPRASALPVQVFKFGGTSVGSPESLKAALRLLSSVQGPKVVVVSAAAGATDALLHCSTTALNGTLEDALSGARAFTAQQQALASSVLSGAPLTDQQARIHASHDELVGILSAIHSLRERTPRASDLVVSRGERLLAHLFAALLEQDGIPTTRVDALDVVHMVAHPGGLWPDLPACVANAAAHLVPPLQRGHTLVVPGYLGRGPQGQLVTLGRGGSDLTAAILGRALSATSVNLCKEVDGLMTADPRWVPDARVIPALHYKEAAELAYYGARVLHPRTMVPLMDAGIPLYIRNTFHPDKPGTRIAGDVRPGAYPVRALSAFVDQAIVSVEGNGMMGVPGMAARVFGALSGAGLSVSMISQASSESSICFVLPQADADAAIHALRTAMKAELDAALVADFRAQRGVAILAVVGMGMRGTPGTAARTLSALAAERINVLAMAQGSSELNITLAVQNTDVKAALGALHREYRLDLERALPDARGREASLVVWGLGQIGRALLGQLDAQAPFFQQDLGLTFRTVGVSDTSGLLSDSAGLSAAALSNAAERKAAKRPLKDVREDAAAQLRAQLYQAPLHTPVLVDLTATDSHPLLMEALDHGFHVVLANKKPLAVPQAQFDALMERARTKGLALRYEATVGAGLPVLDTLAKLRESGDAVHTILGCFSGTLGFLMTRLEAGDAFSTAVRQAFDLGYTEPDPRDDLSGMDVARKALILARTLGHKLDLTDVALEPLFPAALSRDDPQAFLAGLTALDAPYRERIERVRKEGAVLRYVARVAHSGAIRVGLEEVPLSQPPARLQGTENMVVLYTDRYRTNPMVVTGPGAGAAVTASGVLNDLVAIACGTDRRAVRRKA